MYGGELLSNVVSGWVFSKLSIRKSLVLFYSIAFLFGIATVQYGLKTEPNWSIVAFVCLMRFGLGAASNICYLGTPRLFPTLFSVTALGIANFTARSLTITAPLVNELE